MDGESKIGLLNNNKKKSFRLCNAVSYNCWIIE